MDEEFKKNSKFTLDPDSIVQNIDDYRPSLLILFKDLRTSDNKDILTVVQRESVFSNIPVLLYSFRKQEVDLFQYQTKVGYIQLPMPKEQIMIEIERLLYNKKFVLIVDDSKVIHIQLKHIFEEQNFGVLEAYNGQEGLAVLEKQIPDIITSDIEMPVMNGYDFCKALKNNPRTEKIPVLMLSSLDSGIDVDRGFDSGANDYLTKPIDREELISRVNSIIEAANQQNIREKILIVDDSRVIRNLFIQGLEQQGFKTYFGVNGKDGLHNRI